MTVLYNKRETAKRKYIRQAAQTDGPIKQESPEPDRFPLLMDKRQCPCCIGNTAISMEERAFRYCRPAVMNDHFDREYLQPMKAAEECKLITCDHPECQKNGGGRKLGKRVRALSSADLAKCPGLPMPVHDMLNNDSVLMFHVPGASDDEAGHIGSGHTHRPSCCHHLQRRYWDASQSILLIWIQYSRMTTEGWTWLPFWSVSMRLREAPVDEG